MTQAPINSLMEQVSDYLRRFVILTDAQVTVICLWVVHTHAFQAADATAYLNIHSVEKGSGKTRLLEILQHIVAMAWFTCRVSAAVLYRRIQSKCPTLLLDESDAAFGREAEYAQALREVLNMGQRRGGVATCCGGPSVNFAPQEFSVYCPKAIAGIGNLPDTVASRSIPIRLKRRAQHESVARYRPNIVEKESSLLRSALSTWANSNLSKLRALEPTFPVGLNDRQEDGAEPLLAIADLVGGDWPVKARAAIVELCTGVAAEDDSVGIHLLRDIRAIFKKRDADRISSVDLLIELHGMEEDSDWAQLNWGSPLTLRGLAKLLKPFEISSRSIRVEAGTPKGYLRTDFEDAWGRYLPPETQQEQQPNENEPSEAA